MSYTLLYSCHGRGPGFGPRRFRTLVYPLCKVRFAPRGGGDRAAQRTLSAADIVPTFADSPCATWVIPLNSAVCRSGPRNRAVEIVGAQIENLISDASP
jgi:hypothetical protein